MAVNDCRRAARERELCCKSPEAQSRWLLDSGEATWLVKRNCGMRQHVETRSCLASALRHGHERECCCLLSQLAVWVDDCRLK